ncbi:DUF3883 domain-containing protein [Rhodococcus pseudokoreensis]|uniref:DUF3883 domain-containing protein n=1 Tax=Rhodococcus pseudokoreensis TaxID=2811421 RepID=A0A974WA20_9NOCA|nr:DUF3883 domain-containing protein [Rhodococcus pseudokoreensis]QSE93908.1 DUF3883 domain-containing protein [Rhodococcus pseudokoreensis]
MPLVLTQNEVNLSEHEYSDTLGAVYQFPNKYKNLIRPGVPFIYYRGRRRASGATQVPVYLGSGIIGSISQTGDRYSCTITNYQPFEIPVEFKEGRTYREPEANNRKSVGFYFQPGVRVIDQNSFDDICRSGQYFHVASTAYVYADPAATIAVDQLAMSLAVEEACRRFPNSLVERMPHNNPGFDIQIQNDAEPTLYIEVKGTRAPEPQFFVTAGEISFSRTHSSHYSIWIFHSINLDTRDGILVEHAGELGDDSFDLQPTQFFGKPRSSQKLSVHRR